MKKLRSFLQNEKKMTSSFLAPIKIACKLEKIIPVKKNKITNYIYNNKFHIIFTYSLRNVFENYVGK